jgi:hypothetical protein
VVSGEIPILFDYDFNAYRAKYTEKGKFEFVIPCEGSVVFPYVVSLVKYAGRVSPGCAARYFVAPPATGTRDYRADAQLVYLAESVLASLPCCEPLLSRG